MFTTFNNNAFTDMSKAYSTAAIKAGTDFTAQIIAANQKFTKSLTEAVKSEEVQKYVQPVQDAVSGMVKTYTDSVTQFSKSFSK